MSAFDDAVARHMAHAAGSRADGLTETLVDQVSAHAATAWERQHQPAARVSPIDGWGKKAARNELHANEGLAEAASVTQARAQAVAHAHAAGFKRGYIMGVREGRWAGFCWGMAVGCAVMAAALKLGSVA